MITPMQNMLKERLRNSNITSWVSKKTSFSGRSVKKTNVEKELTNFMTSKSYYKKITDKQLVERFCALCNTTPDDRFNPKNKEECTKAIANIIMQHIKQEPTLKNSGGVVITPVADEEVFFDAASDFHESNEQIKTTSFNDGHKTTPENNTDNEIFYDAEGTSHIKLLTHEQSLSLQKEALEAFNIVCKTNYNSLAEMVKSKEMVFLTSNIVDAVLAIMLFSEDFQGQSLLDSVRAIGLGNTEVEYYLNYCMAEISEKKDYRQLIKYQEDLDSLVRNIKYFVQDVKMKSKKMMGYEDPDLKFFSVEEFSIHSKIKKRKDHVEKRIKELETLAQNDSLPDNDKMQATIEYIMYKVQTELVHSHSRVTGLGFNENPFFINEILSIGDKIAEWQTRHAERLDEFNSISKDLDHDAKTNAYVKYFGTGGDGYEKTKFGNCDLFCHRTALYLQEFNYNQGGHGKVFFYPLKSDDMMGHACNYITLGDKVMIVDTWTNTFFNIKDIETFLPQFCQDDVPFAIRMLEMQPCKMEVVSSFNKFTPVNKALYIISKYYPKPKTKHANNNIANNEPPNTNNNS